MIQAIHAGDLRKPRGGCVSNPSIMIACSSPIRETTPKLTGLPASLIWYSGCSMAAAISEAIASALGD